MIPYSLAGLLVGGALQPSLRRAEYSISPAWLVGCLYVVVVEKSLDVPCPCVAVTENRWDKR